MARVTSDGQTRASTTSPLMSQTSHLRDLRQTGCDVMSVLVSQEADVLLSNLANGHDTGPFKKRNQFTPHVLLTTIILYSHLQRNELLVKKENLSN